MITFEKHIALSFGTGLGIGTISTTSGTYVATLDPTYILYSSSLYPNSTFYFEALFKTSAGTASATLWDNTAGAAVASAEVTTTSTTTTRVRSSAIALVDAHEYTMQIKVSGGNTLTYYSSRIIAVQSATNITATETQIPLISNVGSVSSSSYAEPGTIEWGYFHYDAANWNGTITMYMEATFKTSAGTGTVGIHDASDNLVSGGEITTTSASYSRVRTSAITLVDNTDYKVRIKTSAGTLLIADARIIIQQANNPTKSESFITLVRTATATTATSGTFQDSLHKINYDSTNWSVDTITWVHEANANANTASGTFETYNLTGAARTTGSNITSTNNTVITRYRSGTVTMPTTQEITARCDSAAGTIYVGIATLIAKLTWTNPASGGFFLTNFI